MTLFRRPREKRGTYDTNSAVELLRRRMAPLFGRDGTVFVDVDSSERLGAVFACRDLIARLLSTLPVDTFTKRGGVFTPVEPKVGFFETPDPVWRVDGVDWLYQITDQLLARGNQFGLIQGLDRQGYPAALHLLSCHQVSVETQGANGPPLWKVDGDPVEMWPAGELWHIPAYTRPGSPMGMSPIERAALTIGIGLSSLQFGAQWFRDGGIPSAMLRQTEEELTQTAAQLAKQRFLDATRGNREPLVVGKGWEYQQIAVAAEESQFLETTKANVADVCRFFGVFPEDIGGSSGDSMTYANVESRNLQLYVRTLGPWVVRIERNLSRLRPNGQFVKFNIDALLRADSTTRVSVYDKAIRAGWLSVNEVRALEDRPGIGDGGDRYLWPPGRAQLSMDELEEGVDTEEEPLPRSNGHKETIRV